MHAKLETEVAHEFGGKTWGGENWKLLRYPQLLAHNKYAIAFKNNDGMTVGHIPKLIKFMSRLAFFFIKYGGHISAIITRPERYSKDLHQGGLEVLSTIK